MIKIDRLAKGHSLAQSIINHLIDRYDVDVLTSEHTYCNRKVYNDRLIIYLAQLTNGIINVNETRATDGTTLIKYFVTLKDGTIKNVTDVFYLLVRKAMPQLKYDLVNKTILGGITDMQEIYARVGQLVYPYSQQYFTLRKIQL